MPLLDPQQILAQFEAIVGPSNVLTADSAVERYLHDWRRQFHGRALAVLRPAETEEVSRVVRLCAQHGIGIVPQGGNTGLAGGAVPAGGGEQIVLSLERMNAIHAIDPVGLTVDVDAGCVLAVVKGAALEQECTLPISIAAEGSATIGGVVSTNAGGSNVLRHGMTRAFVLGLEVVLPDGEIVRALRPLRKDNAGYDWKQLFIGSEGTLGIVTRAVLRLLPAHRQRAVAFLGLASVDDALRLLGLAMNRLGEAVSAFELISGAALELVARHADVKLPITATNWAVLVEASSSIPGLDTALDLFFEQAFEQQIVSDGVLSQSDTDCERLWAVRERITECEAREGPSIKHDISLPITAIPAFLADAENVLEKLGVPTRTNVFGHLGDGNLHYNVLCGPDADKQAIANRIHELVVRRGGSITAEHGIGQYRLGELGMCKSEVELRIMRKIKHLLDPEAIMNPGKVLAATRHPEVNS